MSQLRNRMQRTLPFLMLTFCFACSLQLNTYSAHAEPVPSVAPHNQAFVAHFAKQPLARMQAAITKGGKPLGHVPSPIDHSYLKGLTAPSNNFVRKSVTLPTSYDLRTLNKVTPVRDQGTCGSCWSFGTIASMESDLLFEKSETWNFSENNLKDKHGFDLGHCDGGNSEIATAYFARWSGPVNESDDPYSAGSNISPAGLTVQKHLQEVLHFPPPQVSDLSSIKQALMQYGALDAAYHEDSTYYNPSTYGYYYSGATTGIYSNHEISIVGWDDSFPAGNFLTAPLGNGAFIIKNSWGAGWGQSGYFYISYYDPYILTDINAFNDAAGTSNYSRVYQYDPLGNVGNFGYGSTTSAWSANVFTAAATENIGAISFHAASPGTSYTIQMYTNVTSTPTSGTLIHTQSGTVSLPGYHTITLTTPVSVVNGQKFSVVMLIDTPGYNYPVPVEYSYPGYSSAATASPGQSYYAFNNSGIPGSWADITTYDSTYNVCIKAFAVGGPVDGSCGNSNKQVFSVAPSTNLCSVGNSSAVTGSGPWNWTCNGLNGGIIASCMAYSTSQQVTPLAQNFDGIVTPLLPPSWSSSGAYDSVYSVTSMWQTNTGTHNPSGIPYGSTAHSGSSLVYFNSWDVSAGVTALLSSPVFSLAGKVGGKAGFWMYHDTQWTSADRVDVYINTTSSLSGAILLGSVSRYNGTSGWYQYTFDIPGTFAGATNYLLINGVSDWGNDIHLDDITVYAFTAVAPTYSLTYTFAGNGYGSVNSAPSGINCTGTTGSSCTPYYYDGGSSVTLTASADSSSANYSIFTGWTPACNGTAPCSITMNGPLNVTGNFTRDKLVKFSNQVSGTYGTILEALGAATPGQTIQVRDNTGLVPFADALVVDKSVSLKGGFASGFGANTGYTAMNGKLTIGNGGALTVERLLIR